MTRMMVITMMMTTMMRMIAVAMSTEGVMYHQRVWHHANNQLLYRCSPPSLYHGPLLATGCNTSSISYLILIYEYLPLSLPVSFSSAWFCYDMHHMQSFQSNWKTEVLQSIISNSLNIFDTKSSNFIRNHGFSRVNIFSLTKVAPITPQAVWY